MSEIAMQQMILRKGGDNAPSAEETARRLDRTGAVIIDRKVGSFLIEGSEEALKSAKRAADGWMAFPTKRYAIPGTRMKVR